MDRKKVEPEREAVSSVERELDPRAVACVQCACQSYRTIQALRDKLRKNRGRLRLIMAVGLGFVVRVCFGDGGVAG